jgi:hypothetical protein
MKQTSQSANGTSFHNDTFNASVSDLRQILGEPADDNNSGEDKVNFEWEMETEAGDVFTVYDWKEYRKLDEHEIIEWHIGGHSGSVTDQAVNEIAGALNELD